MADNNDSFDEFLNRAEEDYDAGDIEAAEAGESPLFFGGSKDVYERDKAFLSEIGEAFYLGDVKAACAFKLITNLIGLSNNVILTEGVFLAKRMGLSEEAFLNGAKSTGAWSYQMQNSGHKRSEEHTSELQSHWHARQRLERYEVRRGDGGRGGSFLPRLRHAEGSL